MNEKTTLIVSAVGIFVCYFYYGIIQEKITRGNYGEDRFTFTLALVGVQCFCNWLFVKLILLARPQKKDETHYGYYLSSASTYLLAMVSSNMALRWVAYPTQVVAKAAKPIPVLLLGVLIGRKNYPLKKYVFIVLIVTGVIFFMYKEGKTNQTQESFGIGEILLFLSLAMDGLTGAIQERMRSSSAPSAQHMMLSMNSWSTIILGALLVVTGEAQQFTAFVVKHPELLVHLASLAVAGALGQLFIFMMVASFGPLPCSVVTTTRKFFTVLFSVIFFGNSLTNRQWFGTVLVFVGLFADMLLGKSSAPKVKGPEGKKLIGAAK